MTVSENILKNGMDSEQRFRELFSYISIVIIIIGVTSFVGLLVYMTFSYDYTIYILNVIVRNYAAVIGIPCSALAALAVVLILRSAQGPLEFKGMGWEFRGAAAPVLMWILCFIAIIGAVRLLWEGTDGILPHAPPAGSTAPGLPSTTDHLAD